ncbi:MAG: hypothetical protein AMXMBFR13_43160 [Phycisphaerae bacterium]
MTADEPNSYHPLHALVSSGVIARALEALAEASYATALLLDPSGRLLAGPVAGNTLFRRILAEPDGVDAIVCAYRSLAMSGGSGVSGESCVSEGPLDRFLIPVTHGDRRLAYIGLGCRPRQPLTESAIRSIEATVGAPAGALQSAAEALRPWNADEAQTARTLATLLAELLAALSTADEDLHRRIDELSTVYNIVGLLAGTRDLQVILDKTARMVCEVMRVKACSIRMLDEASGVLTVQAVFNLSDEYLNKGPVTVDENPIDAAAIRGEMVRIIDAPADPRTRYPEQARKEGIVSGLVCGMIYRGKAVGVLRVYTGEPHAFSPFEEALLRAVASQAAAAVINARLMAETIEAERYARQMAYAGEVQRRMIPAGPPAHPGLDIGAVYRPTYQVGGDFYDFILLPKGNLGVAIADVSGKGVPASLVMASLRSALRVYAYFMYDIDRILSEVNRHVCRETTIREFVTAFYGVITPDGRRMTYCNAGHDPPVLLRRDRIQNLETGGMVLGVDPKAVFERAILTLEPGDVLMLYTDGAVEALNFHDERFGRQRLQESLIRHADQPAQLAAQNILWDIRRFRGLADRTDDVTLVIIKVQ